MIQLKQQGVPFSPELIDRLAVRLPTALAEPFDAESCHLGSQTPPDQLPRQCFDFAGGMRLVIYRAGNETVIWSQFFQGGMIEAYKEAIGVPGYACPRWSEKDHQAAFCPECVKGMLTNADWAVEGLERFRLFVQDRWGEIGGNPPLLKTISIGLFGSHTYVAVEEEG